MIFLKTDEEIELLRASNLIVSATLAELAKHIKPGVSTETLDHIAEEFIRDNGAKPSFLGYDGFPKSICTSVNCQAVHAIPSDYELKDGDIISVDCGALKDGFHGDSCFTFCVGEVADHVRKFVKTGREALELGISIAKEGIRLGDLGNAIQTYCDGFGYSIVKRVLGHGIGRSLHEEPYFPHYGHPKFGIMLKEGMVISVEPLISMGKGKLRFCADGWTGETKDGSLAVQFEKTIAIRRGCVDELSSFDCIDKVLVKNK